VTEKNQSWPFSHTEMADARDACHYHFQDIDPAHSIQWAAVKSMA
jgi:hypothetical protein